MGRGNEKKPKEFTKEEWEELLNLKLPDGDGKLQPLTTKQFDWHKNKILADKKAQARKDLHVRNQRRQAAEQVEMTNLNAINTAEDVLSYFGFQEVDPCKDEETWRRYVIDDEHVGLEVTVIKNFITDRADIAKEKVAKEHIIRKR